MTIEKDALNLINQSRLAHDAKPVRPGRLLTWYAERHAKKMAGTGNLYHSADPGAFLTERNVRWKFWGENVGVADRSHEVATVLHEAYMASEHHRANILNPVFERVGLGFAHDAENRLWNVAVFRA